MKKILFFPNIIKFVIIVLLYVVKLITLASIPNFKIIYLSDNDYYVINKNIIQFVDTNTQKMAFIYMFLQTDMSLLSQEETEMISYGTFKNDLDMPNLLIIKDYSNLSIYFPEKLNQNLIIFIL